MALFTALGNKQICAAIAEAQSSVVLAASDISRVVVEAKTAEGG
jgi:hypothetical protein